MVRKEMPGKPTKKPGKFISRFIAFYALFQLLRAVIGFGPGGIGNSIIMVLLFLLLIGLSIGLFAAKMKQSPIERVRGAEDTIREKTKAAAQQAAKRPEIRFLRGGDVEEDDFAMPSSDRCKRRREQLETLYRAGLYTREEYAAERAKLKEQ